ncbi:MAG TPA: OB-fold nucleic acid binding domain-containing protein, partial [Acidimicrobiales bacterium]|nr:OB-fold nucleic acid binding domain-containing protein [Acidimicrobiales bacterium]
ITRADAVRLGLLFERFLSPSRDGPPDIDLDIESGRREEVIQYVYERYGRHHAAQVANVITYRGRSAVRDMARALGYAPGQQDAWAKQVDRWGSLAETPSGEPARPNPTGSDAAQPPGGAASHHDTQMAKPERAGPLGRPSSKADSTASRSAWRGETLRSGEHSIPPEVLDLARQTQGAPRHLGIHSGGMVICDRPVIEVCPVEHARMAGRTVLQWDKDDCAAAGLVKFDLLGLGMLTALHHAVDLIAEHRGYELDLAALDQEDAVYQMLCRADSIGVFQVESRAQMATLPRLKPRTFYDLVVEVALIRPGPIQGGSVHPYIRRRNGTEEVTYAHPLLEPALAKTLGVPLFQEQFMQIAIDAAGFSATEADELRQAMGSKRSRARMDRLRERLFTGMAARGITGEVAEDIWHKLVSFADYGFPESHAVSFAYLVYSSSWIKLYEPAAFCAALLNAQPMGFYSPHTLCQDARRHGVTVHGPDLVRSVADATLEPCDESHNQVAVRLGLSSVRSIGDDQAAAIVSEREANGPYLDLADLARRTGLNQTQLESLALAGAVPTADVTDPTHHDVAISRPSTKSVVKSRSQRQISTNFTDGTESGTETGTAERQAKSRNRREALWAAGAAAQSRPGRLPGIVTGTDAPTLPGMSASEEAVADLVATGVSATGHPTRFIRDELDRMGVIPAARLATVRIPADAAEADKTSVPAELRGRRVVVAGVVTHRQRPATAGGTMFINLEDETGLVNVIASKGCWMRYRAVARGAPALVVRGRLERVEGVVNVVAEKITELDLDLGPLRSRNYR